MARRGCVIYLRSPVHAGIVLRSILPATAQRYRYYLAIFHRFLRLRRLGRPESLGRWSFSSVRRLDAAVAAFFDWVTSSRRPVSWCRVVLSALSTFNAHIPASAFVRSAVLLRRLARLHVPRSATPLSWPLTVVLALYFARHFGPAAAVALLVGFDCYLRVSELCRLTTADVRRPVDGGASSSRPVLVLRHTKTGRGRPQLVVVNRPLVAALLDDCVQHCRPGGRLFPFTPALFRRRLARACADLGLCPFTPHSLRHGGATSDFIAGVSVQRIMLRGRWLSFESCRRYLQLGRAQVAVLHQFGAHARVGTEMLPRLRSLLRQFFASQ